MLRELGRFRASDGSPLVRIAERFSAIDARDGRAIAATADVDAIYRMGDQLYVEPDARLEECFGIEEPIRMTRQEIAVARSHIEVWKAIANGKHNHVLVLEDDVWFKSNAPQEINRGWRAAMRHCAATGGPLLLYLSYADAGGTAERCEICEALFRPVRGLWFLSGYVLSRQGAMELLKAMPVVGPVDLWMNYQFVKVGALALSTPAILQREDLPSDNSYSVIPYLARAGLINAGSGLMSPDRTRVGVVLGWSAGHKQEGLPMALSMLGLRVRVFDGNEKHIQAEHLLELCETFDSLIDAPLAPCALILAMATVDIKFVLEESAALSFEMELRRLPPSRTVVLSKVKSWEPLCALLSLERPVQAFPIGAPRQLRIFRDDRLDSPVRHEADREKAVLIDDSPWVLPPSSDWRPRNPSLEPSTIQGTRVIHAAMTSSSPFFSALVETFPGNLAKFERQGLMHDESGARLEIIRNNKGQRPYRSGAFASKSSFEHGQFEAHIKAAKGVGLVTGFFLHRDAPRQEIDIELVGCDPRHMLINVYFNPGDDGAAFGFGYRGSPCRIDLGFDATMDFHQYAIDWRPGRIAWVVDGKVVHERVGWDPTPLPHLPMRLHANLWAPESEELAGRIGEDDLPATATFRDVSVWSRMQQS